MAKNERVFFFQTRVRKYCTSQTRIYMRCPWVQTAGICSFMAIWIGEQLAVCDWVSWLQSSVCDLWICVSLQWQSELLLRTGAFYLVETQMNLETAQRYKLTCKIENKVSSFYFGCECDFMLQTRYSMHVCKMKHPLQTCELFLFHKKLYYFVKILRITSTPSPSLKKSWINHYANMCHFKFLLLKAQTFNCFPVIALQKLPVLQVSDMICLIWVIWLLNAATWCKAWVIHSPDHLWDSYSDGWSWLRA